MQFYTHFVKTGGMVFERYIENGVRKERVVDLEPKLFIKTKEASQIKSLYGDNLKPVAISDYEHYKEKTQQFQNAGYSCYGFEPIEYSYISDVYGLECAYNSEKILVFTLDIETEVPDSGFPDAIEAKFPVTVVTIHHSLQDKYYVFAHKDFDVTKDVDNISPERIVKKIYNDERTMMLGLLKFWNDERPDVLSGWFTSNFDLKYLYNRTKQLGIKFGKKNGEDAFSLIGKTIVKKDNSVEFKGISHLDYAIVMKKFNAGERSWSLNSVGEDYLGVKKVANPYPHFKDFYTKDWNLFVTYNIRDVELVVKLMRKTRQLELIYSLAYLTGCNYNDVLGTLKPWEIYIQNVLKLDNVYLTTDKFSPGAEGSIMGGYVKDPIPGKYEWLVSFDQNSLYPSIIRTWNISPETIIDEPPSELKPYSNKIYTEIPKELSPLLKKHKVAMTANGQFFKTDKQGIMAKLCEHVYNQRVETKNQMKKLKKENYEKGITDNTQIDILDHKQYALKILLNSLYGALANRYFMFFDFRCAEGITATGQYIIKRIGEEVAEEIDRISGSQDSLAYTDTDSVGGKSKIYVNDSLIDICDFYNDSEGYIIKRENDNLVKVLSKDYNTKCVLKNGKESSEKITYVMKHLVKKNMYRIVCGDKELTITDDHSIIVYRDGKLKNIKIGELNEKDRIIIRE